MSISLKDQKMLWGRAASRCAFPDCRRQLVVDATETDEGSLVGDASHIIAKEASGPRGDYPLCAEERDRYDNLILLCKIHHKLLDDQPLTYTVERLKKMKAAHEKWVSESLREFDGAKQRDDELYAAYVDEWLEQADVSHWDAWSSFVLGSGQPHMDSVRFEVLEKLRVWLFSRIWPGRYAELESAFVNFLHVLGALLDTFSRHAERRGEMLWTEKFYHLREWDPPRYEQLALQFDFHVALVMDLMLELTRAANYICDWVRAFIDPNFRLREGMIMTHSGPYMDVDRPEWDLHWVSHRVEYRGKERVFQPYGGVEQFQLDREARDVHFGKGKGVSRDDPEVERG